MDYRAARETRIGQFATCLAELRGWVGGRGRRHGFIRFQEDPSGGDPHACSPAAAEVVAKAGDRPPRRRYRGPVQPRSPGESSTRFVQFAYVTGWFTMDLPRQTLCADEAERLLRRRTGFFWLRERPQFRTRGEDLDAFEPVRKIYLYGDEGLAAEDIGWLFFDLWKFPVDWKFYVCARSFRGGGVYAHDLPLALP